MKYFYSLIILLFFYVTPIFSQYQKPAIPWETGESKAENLRIFLVTIGPGNEVTDSWGHIGLAVSDTVLNVHRVYNFGFFTFDEGFVRHFAMGRLTFWAGDVSLAYMNTRYKRANRTISYLYLNIPLQKRMEMAKELARLVQPENRNYLYDHFSENCATRLRDIVNTALDGRLEEQLSAISAKTTYRKLTIRYTESDPLFQWLLMFLMNATIDRNLSQWEVMFLPDFLEKNLANFSYSDSIGSEFKLGETPIVYFDSQKEATPERANNVPLWTVLVGLLGSIFLLFMVFLEKQEKRIGFWGWRLFSILYAFVMGVLGTLLFFMSLFTDHIVTYANENLFFANPLLLVIALLQTLVLFKPNIYYTRLIKMGWTALAGTSVVLILLKLTPWFNQDNYMALVIALPLSFTFALSSFLTNKN